MPRRLLKRFFSRAPSPVQPAQDAVLGVLPFGSKAPQWSKWDSKKAVEEGYQASPWVYAAVKRRVDAVASVPWVVERRTKDGWEIDDSHALNRLLHQPNARMSWEELISLTVTQLDLSGNAFWHEVKLSSGRVQEIWPIAPWRVAITPSARMSWEELLSLTVTQLDLSGNAFWHEVKLSSGRVQEIWPIAPWRVAITPSATGLTVGGYTLTDSQQNIAAEDMVHIRYTNPDGGWYGQSPLQAVGKAVDVDNAAAAWQKVSMQNRGVPDGIFQADDPHMTPEQFEQAENVVKEKYAQLGRARQPWILNQFKWVPMSLTPAEVDFIETRNLTRKEICAVYGVPEAMIVGMGDANRASAETVRRTFWLDTIIPLLDELAQTLTKDLAREFGTDIRLNYDVSSVPALQDNQAEKMDLAKALHSMGVPFNVINEKLELGFDDVEGGDVGYLPSSLLPTNIDFGEFLAPKTDDELKHLIEISYGKNTDTK